MYIVIFEKETKRIVLILPKDDPDRVALGYSDNCAKATVDEKPEGQFFDGEPDPPEPEPEIVDENEGEGETEAEEEPENEEQSEENTETEKD